MPAGLNILPKKSFATEYSYRTRLDPTVSDSLQGWVKSLAPLDVPRPPKGSHWTSTPSPTEATPPALDRHYLPLQGKAGTSVLTFFEL